MKIKDWMKLGFGSWVAINTYTFLMSCESAILDRLLSKLDKKDSKPENEEES